MRYKVTLSYDGTNYAGFQSQKNAVGIQDEIEKALKEIYQTEIKITLASRTDAGVHALGQVFSFESDKILLPYRIKTGLNTFLPKDIHIINVEEVDSEFHPRYHVKEKTYEYLVYTGEFNPLLINRAYQCSYPLDVERMKEAMKVLVGKHDFGSFNTASYKEYPNQVRTIKSFTLTEKKGLLIFKVTGDGFLRNMVRIMVGTLIEIGRGKKEVDETRKMLEHIDKSTRRYNISPSGLYLVNIKYKEYH